MQGAILPGKTTAIHISSSLSLFFFLSILRFTSTRYDKTWTVNQSPQALIFSDILLFHNKTLRSFDTLENEDGRI